MGNGASVSTEPHEALLPEGLQKQRSVEIMEERGANHITENIVNGELQKEFHEFYNLNSSVSLGSGMNGEVRIVTHKITGIKFAMKTLTKSDIINLDDLRNEIRIMAELDHPNIIRIEEYFETASHVYIIMELCTGGDLLSRIYKEKVLHFSEHKACELVKMMLSALRYMHDRGIVHRDIKLENFLCLNESPESPIKVIDFGFSQHFKPTEKLHKGVGSPYYVAPEVLEGSYDCKIDIWGIGVVAFMLLTGTPPFNGRDEYEIFNAIKYQGVDYNRHELSHYTPEALDFLSCCLERNVKLRPNASEALQHPWFTTLKSDEPNEHLSQLVLGRLQEFTTKNVFGKLCMEVVAHSLTPEQMEDLRKEFLVFDEDGTGSIKLENLKHVLKKDSQISDADVDKIFNDLDVEHTGQIHYHEFIAGALDLKDVTEKNMELAFEKMSHHRNVISKKDISSLLGMDAKSEDVDRMLADAGLSEADIIDFATFKRIMLGQQSAPKLTSPYRVYAKHVAQHNFKTSDNNISPKEATWNAEASGFI